MEHILENSIITEKYINEIKKNNQDLSNNFINIKDLEKN
mgnify:CR=1 FL=1